MTFVLGPRDAGSDRHPLRDVLLGAWVTLGPLLTALRHAPRGPTAAPPPDPEIVDVCLGILALAWRLEGVLLAAAADALPPAPPVPPAQGRIFR